MKDILSIGLREFDVYRLTETLSDNDMICEIENEHMKVSDKFRAQYLKFVKEFSKLFEKRL